MDEARQPEVRLIPIINLLKAGGFGFGIVGILGPFIGDYVPYLADPIWYIVGSEAVGGWGFNLALILAFVLTIPNRVVHEMATGNANDG